MEKIFRIGSAILTWVTIITQYWLIVRSGDFDSITAATIRYLGYFTILTNILVGLAFTAPFLNPNSKIRAFFERQTVRAAIALYILVVAVVYWALLASIHNPVGLSAIANIGLHLVLPVLYIIDWLAFSSKGSMSFKSLPYWVAYPMAYGILNIIRGQLTGFYPYPFLNITELGLGSVAMNMLGFTSIYLIGGALFIILGRILSSKDVALS